MDIKELDINRGVVVLRTTSRQDIFLLFLVIDSYTEVEKVTYWVEKDSEKSQKRKIKLKVRIMVEKKELYEDYLKVTGKIIYASKDIGKGHYISLKIGIGESLMLYKKLTRKDIKILKLAERKVYDYIIVALDLDEASIAILEGTKLKVITTITNNNKEEKREYYGEIASKISELVDRYNVKAIIIGSPLDWAKELKNFIEERYKPKVKIKSFSISYGGENGIRELLKRKEVLKFIEETEYGKLVRDLELLKVSLIEGKVVSIKETQDLDFPIKKILIAEEVLYNKAKIDLLEEIVKRDIEFEIIPKNIEDYQLITSLGGIVGILHYKVF